MSKNLFQDMVKIKRVSRQTPPILSKEVSFKSLPLVENKGNRTRYKIWLVVVISILFFIFAISYLFLKAVVTVNPRMQDLTLNENLSASLNGGVDVLPFDLIVISGEEDKIVQTTEEKDVLEKAKGIVLIYNTFSSKTQRLDIDTRLLGSNGKIYKTNKVIVVPGMGGGTPGFVEVGIYGADAGEEYNSGPLDFTIFGFKGTPKYSKFYARSKGEIAGGFKGKMPVISDAQKLVIINDLKTTLQTKLFQKATDQIPEGFILFKDAVFFHTDDSNIKFSVLTSSDDNITIKIKGTLYGFLFNKEKLAKKIAENSINDYDGSVVYASNIQDLTFFLSNKDNISFGSVKNIDFNLKGVTKIIWKLDESKFIADLLGKSKKDFRQILLQYANIDSANLTISPFWKMSLPDKIKDIKVFVNYPK